MPRRVYKDIVFSDAKLDKIEHANRICEQYARMGLDLTLRQLFYRFVAANLLPNKQSAYKALGDLLNDARMAGLIDWDHMVDRTRGIRGLRHWAHPKDLLEEVEHTFAIDKWKDQPNNVEVWVEKDALVGVLQAACVPLDVPFFSCRGYTSATSMWEAAQRIRSKIANGHAVTVLHLGDHDPSGVDMTRDIHERLDLFLRTDLRREDRLPRTEVQDLMEDAFTLNRIALTPAQIEQYDPPPNPAKLTDTRARGYIQRFGRDCWELDALPPEVIIELITSHVMALRDEPLWDAAVQVENAHKANIRKIRQNYDIALRRIGEAEGA